MNCNVMSDCAGHERGLNLNLAIRKHKSSIAFVGALKSIPCLYYTRTGLELGHERASKFKVRLSYEYDVSYN